MDYDTIPARHPGMVQPVVTSTPCNPLLVQGNPKLYGTYHLTFAPAGIHWHTKSIDSRIAWDQYTSVLEDNRMWLLMYGKRLYTIVPKCAFKDAEEVARFSSLIVRHICPATNKNAADDV